MNNLAALRRERGFTQDRLAAAMGTHQPVISRIERGGEVKISTLRRYIEALGGRLELLVILDDRVVVIDV